MSDFQSLDAVVTGCAFQYATAALGVLEEGGRSEGTVSPEMLCTLDNFIRVLLFSDRVFVTSAAGVKDRQLASCETEFGGRAESKKLFDDASVFRQLPASPATQKVMMDNVKAAFAPLEPVAGHVVLSCKLPKRKVSVQQEMFGLDLFIIEDAIEQGGAQRFKPVFPGEHLYLGLRTKRLAQPRATHTMADVAGIRLRELIAGEMEKLNKLAGFGAPYLPPLPPIFVTQLMRGGRDRGELTAQILALRNSRQFRSFRDQAKKCMALAYSPDTAKRKQAADILAELEKFSFQAKSSHSTIISSIKFVAQLAKGDLAGIALGQVESVIDYLSRYSLGALERYSGASLDGDTLDEFLVRNFGAKFNRNDLNSVSMFLGLPENMRQWAKEDFEIEASAGRVDSDTPPFSRPFTFEVEDPDVVRSAKDDFDDLWKRAKPIRLDPKTGEIVVDD